jgi:hypothetical protein
VGGMTDRRDQRLLFDESEGTLWGDEWKDMPEFIQDDIKPHSSINVQFENIEDRRVFLEKLGERPSRIKSIWFPKKEYLKQSTVRAPSTTVPKNRYPVYIISKGRWDTRLTSNTLEKLGIHYHIVVEPQERENYAAVINPNKILTLPFSNLGEGSIPARNWVWEHAVKTGVTRHWILDDNIDGFYRLNKNLKIKVIDENPFTPIETFCDRYTNMAIAGMQYEFFTDRRSKHPPILLNTRIYSCILLQNDIPYRWRGRYNEDTDLSLRVLKDGLCTVLFNTFLCNKMPTMVMDGGNSNELYADDGRLKMAQSLADQHPDVVTVSFKWGRPQHHVDYRRFHQNKPIKLVA